MLNRFLQTRSSSTVAACRTLQCVGMVGTKQTSQFHAVETPSAWHSNDFKNPQQWLVKLLPEQLQELRAAVDLHEGVPEEGLHRLSAKDFPLPTLGPVLSKLRDEIVDGKGFAIVRGLSPTTYSLR